MAFVAKKKARPGDLIDPIRVNAPEAPGAVVSPQAPGEVPDRSSIPGEGQLPVPPPEGDVRRPLTEYGTAQRIMGVFEPEGGNADDPARFEQATATYEEIRKAYPALRTPNRPVAGYALSDGVRLTINGPAQLEPGSADLRDPGE